MCGCPEREGSLLPKLTEEEYASHGEGRAKGETADSGWPSGRGDLCEPDREAMGAFAPQTQLVAVQ